MVMIGWFPLASLGGLGGEGMPIDDEFHPIIIKNQPLKGGGEGIDQAFSRLTITSKY